ncbi:MAG TPA: 1-(5-phosphoribosyl)-5-[(5-phosphoribosylamino)methylideneamino]imidazole-4-carboxamide isomerase [Steroidobacteraceae bacterium]|nr:1-(5-phosphoribosyl)-5-[(5-phosphoribosylamino)methylideneamino]imidazole-4-carboxamide isomerase [Steroidobacteraceae bacterium]
MELIPAIDLKGGRCVRLYKGDFAAETVYSNEPASILQKYRELGAARVHIVDLDGAKDGTQANLATIEDLAKRATMKVQVGGGLRTIERVKQLLDRGVQRAVIGSIAINDPQTVIGWLDSVSADSLVLALDVRLDASGQPWLTTHGWLETSNVLLWDAVERFAARGMRHVLCTDVSRDGAMTGPNLDLYADAVRRFPNVQWQASGGVSNGADLHNLRQCGVAAVISGKAMLENSIPVEELRPFLPNASSPA